MDEWDGSVALSMYACMHVLYSKYCA